MADDRTETILVSSCLLGLPTRYDGRSKASKRVHAYLKRHHLVPIPVCPEQLAGLPTPRPKTCFFRGDGRSLLAGDGEVRNEYQQVVNKPFLHGARQVLAIARLSNCQRALLKERSPSCGCREIYRGEDRVPGMGVTAALLEKHGIDVFSEEQLPGE